MILKSSGVRVKFRAAAFSRTCSRWLALTKVKSEGGRVRKLSLSCFLRCSDLRREFRRALEADNGNVFVMMKLARALYEFAVASGEMLTRRTGLTWTSAWWSFGGF